MKLVLLPGLDGTGELFSSFAQALLDSIDVKKIMYPFKEGLGYDILIEYVLDVLPKNEPFVLLGESFSGPIAIEVASKNVLNMQGLILVNSFLENPRPWLLRFTHLVPDELLLKPPKRILQWMLKNAEPEAVSVEALQSTLSSLSASLVRHRLSSVATVNVHSDTLSIKVPVCILQSTTDTAVSSRAAKQLVSAFPQSTKQLFNTNHFLLQAMPKRSAGFVDKFVCTCCSTV